MSLYTSSKPPQTAKPSSKEEPIMQLEKVLGCSSSEHASIAWNEHTGEVAWPAGSVIVIYNPRTNTQAKHIFGRVNHKITCLAFSRDGRYLAAGEEGKQPAVLLWDLNTGTRAQCFGHTYGISSVHFASNEQFLISIGNTHDRHVIVRRWCNSDGTLLDASSKGLIDGSIIYQRQQPLSHVITGCAVSEDGDSIVCCGPGHLTHFYINSAPSKKGDTITMKSGELGDHQHADFIAVATGKGPSAPYVYCLTRSGVLCVFKQPSVTQNWEIEKWVDLRLTTGFALSISNNAIAIAGAEGKVRLFEPISLKHYATLPKPPIPASLGHGCPDTVHVALNIASEKLMCVYADKSVLFWDVGATLNVETNHNQTKKPVPIVTRRFLFHGSGIWDLSVPNDSSDVHTVSSTDPSQEAFDSPLPPGSFVTCGADGTVRFWNLGHNDSLVDSKHEKKYGYIAESLFFGISVAQKGGSYPFANHDMLNSNKKAATLANTFKKTALSFQDAKSNTPAALRCLEVIVTPDGDDTHQNKLLLSSGDKKGNLRFHDLHNNMKQIALVRAHNKEIRSLHYSGTESHILASGSRDTFIHLYDMTHPTNPKVLSLPPQYNHSAAITSVRFADPISGEEKGCRLVSAAADKNLIFRNVSAAQDVTPIAKTIVKRTIYDIAVHPTNKFLISCGQDKYLRIWNMSSGKLSRSYKIEGLTARYNGTDSGLGQGRPSTAASAGEAIKVSLDPSGLYFVVSTSDKWLRLYDWFSGACVARVYGHSQAVTAVKFSQDCRRIISVSVDGCIFVWRLSDEFTSAMRSRLSGLRPHSAPGQQRSQGLGSAFSMEDLLDDLGGSREDMKSILNESKLKKSKKMSKKKSSVKKDTNTDTTHTVSDSVNGAMMQDLMVEDVDFEKDAVTVVATPGIHVSSNLAGGEKPASPASTLTFTNENTNKGLVPLKKPPSPQLNIGPIPAWAQTKKDPTLPESPKIVRPLSAETKNGNISGESRWAERVRESGFSLYSENQEGGVKVDGHSHPSALPVIMQSVDALPPRTPINKQQPSPTVMDSSLRSDDTSSSVANQSGNLAAMLEDDDGVNMDPEQTLTPATMSGVIDVTKSNNDLHVNIGAFDESNLVTSPTSGKSTSKRTTPRKGLTGSKRNTSGKISITTTPRATTPVSRSETPHSIGVHVVTHVADEDVDEETPEDAAARQGDEFMRTQYAELNDDGKKAVTLDDDLEVLNERNSLSSEAFKQLLQKKNEFESSLNPNSKSQQFQKPSMLVLPTHDSVSLPSPQKIVPVLEDELLPAAVEQDLTIGDVSESEEEGSAAQVHPEAKLPGTPQRHTQTGVAVQVQQPAMDRPDTAVIGERTVQENMLSRLEETFTAISHDYEVLRNLASQQMNAQIDLSYDDGETSMDRTVADGQAEQMLAMYTSRLSMLHASIGNLLPVLQQKKKQEEEAVTVQASLNEDAILEKYSDKLVAMVAQKLESKNNM